MKPQISKPQLKIVPKPSSQNHQFLQEHPSEQLYSLETAMLSLMKARESGALSESSLDVLVQALQEAKCPQTLVQRSLDVCILLSNFEGDTSVCLKYDLANFGRKVATGRTHRFWFTYPQKKVAIAVSNEQGMPLDTQEVDSSLNFKEVRVHFPKPLEPADQISYRIQYNERRESVLSQFYDITAWTITSRMSFTVIAPYGGCFKDWNIKSESADGYISDNPPQLIIGEESGRQKLTWNFRSAKPGDQFRTAWTLVKNC